MLTLLLVVQGVAALVLLLRLEPGRRRKPPVAPCLANEPATPVSIVVPTLDEAGRITPLIEGALAQGAPVSEIIFVDSGSRDGTRELLNAAAARDPRVRVERDPALPDGWIGKAWALQHGASVAKAPWMLGLDADTAPRPGLAAAVVAAAERYGYDAVSFAPRFAGQRPLERWLQPAMLTTLVYRLGPAGDEAPPERLLANGQCFLVRRDVLLAHGGYAPVRSSFAEDVSLARHLARRGARVGFLDGHLLYDVRSYDSAGQMWREWGRSIDLKDATRRVRQALDVAFLVLVQGLPLPIVAAALFSQSVALRLLLPLNAGLLAVRWLLTLAMAPSYERRGAAFWASPLADPVAVVRVIVSSLRRPRQWRTRAYPAAGAVT